MASTAREYIFRRGSQAAMVCNKVSRHQILKIRSLSWSSDPVARTTGMGSGGAGPAKRSSSHENFQELQTKPKGQACSRHERSIRLASGRAPSPQTANCGAEPRCFWNPWWVTPIAESLGSVDEISARGRKALSFEPSASARNRLGPRGKGAIANRTPCDEHRQPSKPGCVLHQG